MTSTLASSLLQYSLKYSLTGVSKLQNEMLQAAHFKDSICPCLGLLLETAARIQRMQKNHQKLYSSFYATHMSSFASSLLIAGLVWR